MLKDEYHVKLVFPFVSQVLSRQHCRFMYGMHDIDRSMMCTFEKERDACQGDSGSALMIEPKNEAGGVS